MILFRSLLNTCSYLLSNAFNRNCQYYEYSMFHFIIWLIFTSLWRVFMYRWPYNSAAGVRLMLENKCICLIMHLTVGWLASLVSPAQVQNKHFNISLKWFHPFTGKWFGYRYRIVFSPSLFTLSLLLKYLELSNSTDHIFLNAAPNEILL